jgi:hypothetical protein
MNNPTIKNALNGVAINAATNGDIDAVAALQLAAEILTSIVPTSRTATLTPTSYDAVASSTTAFLTFSGLTTNVTGASGQASPQLDSQQKTATQMGISATLLGA